ncbi:MAG: hypothetical protein IJ460_02010 [Clostridia bacterium]|nr:hypothetical protein [Clostridia bacterium]
MADELQDKLNSILSDPEMLKNISSLAKSLGGQSTVPSRREDNFSEEAELISNMQSLMSSADMSSDSRINLLNALRPYMRPERAQHMDTAVKILKLTKLTSVLKDI